MNKHITFFAALLCVAQMAWAATLAPSVSLTEYYAGADGKSGEALRSALNSKINSHTTVSYDALKYLFKWTDTYNNEGTTIDDIYSFCDPAYTETWCSGTCGYNREHSVPKSWFGEASPLYSDAFHLYPTNCYVNSYRGNEPFGECSGGTKCTTNGVQAKGRKGTSTFAGYSGTVYEPDDEFKGDLARTYFYMVTCYMSSNFTQAEGGRAMFTYTDKKAQLTQYSIDLLLKWHRQDPVSARELARNEVIYGNTDLNKGTYKQGNRNPFIDYPEMAEYIWGTKKGQSLDLETLVSAYDDGETPQPATTKYGVTWSVNGEEQQVDSVKENHTVTALPDEPVSCSKESGTFMGWTTASISGTQNDAPAVLYRVIADFPAVTEDVTYYAVFAQKETAGNVEPAVYTYNADSKEGWTNTAAANNAYWILRTGQYLESPEVDLAGLTSVVMTLRTYGGASYNTVHITAGDTELGTIVAANNKLTEYTWTNTETLSGSAPLRFTGSEATDSYGVAFSVVTVNAAGAKVTYSRYITSCQGTTEIQSVPTDVSARKILVGGQIYILMDGQLFNVMGQRVN